MAYRRVAEHRVFAKAGIDACITLAIKAMELITERGFNRGKDLISEFNRDLKKYSICEP